MAKGALQKRGRSATATRRLERNLRLTPLDNLITNAIVDSRQGVAGALAEKELIETVDEFIRLNGRRQQSYLHAGFRDALFGLPLGAELPAQNEARARWYWTGVVSGLARSQSWDRLIELYDAEDSIRSLGDGRDRASRLSAPLIIQALRNEDRVSELVDFAHARLVRRPEVYRLLLDAGTQSLRSRTPAIAKSVFSLLLDAEEGGESRKPLRSLMLTAQRRMAHCMRLLGEHQGAEDILNALLKEEQDPGVQAMLHADVGLLKGRFALLDEVRIPDERAALADFVERLRLGEDAFNRAVANPDVAYACHGHYCLGVLALSDKSLGEGRFEAATMHLERAHAPIHGDAEYPRSLVAQTDLYLGIAKAHLLEAAELEHAAKLVASGLSQAQIPRHLIADTVEKLAFSDVSVELVAGHLLKLDNDEGLDALASTTIAETHAPLATALHERAHRPNRRKVLVIADLHRALRGFLRVEELNAAREVLDELERHAVQGSGVDEFLEILDNRDCYDPAWDDDEAAVASARCLEAAGRYSDSLAKLRPLFHRRMHEGAYSDASGILERIAGYGIDASEYADLTNRHKSAANSDPAPTGDGVPVKVLVVGGDEMQARLADNVTRRLAERDTHVTVEFLHTGWDSNWAPYVDQVRTRLSSVDAVVVMRLIRTTLGRHVRRLCGEHDTLWWSCWSGGGGGIAHATLEAASVFRVSQATNRT